MATEKCDYCGRELDEKFFGTLDNGSRACNYCMEDEGKRLSKETKTKSEKNDKKEWA